MDPAIDIGDKIIIDGKPVIYQGEMTYESRFIADISSKIQIKAKEETSIKKESQRQINKKMKSDIDQVEGKITQIIEEQSDFDEKLSEVKQTADSVTQKVENNLDFKREAEGLTEIYLENSAKKPILELEIEGNKTYENFLYPSEDLYPSESLYPNMEGSELI